MQWLYVVRLVDGASSNEGRVEVYYSGSWGTVCSDGGWNNEYASLVCAQLGFGTSGESADFGPGYGNILLEIIECSLNHTFPASCSHYGIYVRLRCDHSKDIGVKCNGMYLGSLHIVFWELYPIVKEWKQWHKK